MTIRGNNDEAVFRDDQDYSAYLEQLAGTIGRFAISLLAYGLMTNHIHLVVRTPQPNISGAMQWLHGCYAALFNCRQHRRGQPQRLAARGERKEDGAGERARGEPVVGRHAVPGKILARVRVGQPTVAA